MLVGSFGVCLLCFVFVCMFAIVCMFACFVYVYLFVVACVLAYLCVFVRVFGCVCLRIWLDVCLRVGLIDRLCLFGCWFVCRSIAYLSACVCLSVSLLACSHDCVY